MAKAKTTEKATSKTTRKATRTETAKKTASKTTPKTTSKAVAKKATRPMAAKSASAKTKSTKTKPTAKSAATKAKPASAKAKPTSSTKAPTSSSTKTKSTKTTAAQKKTLDEKVTIDRRAEGNERGTPADRRQKSEPVAVERRSIERRAKVNRRRQIDPTTCERDYTDEELEFMNAMDDYKRTSGRMFPTCSEVLEVIRGLGYGKLPVVEEVAAEQPNSEEDSPISPAQATEQPSEQPVTLGDPHDWHAEESFGQTIGNMHKMPEVPEMPAAHMSESLIDITGGNDLLESSHAPAVSVGLEGCDITERVAF